MTFTSWTKWTGKTWPHKAYIKELGGTWNPAIKAWLVPPQGSKTRIKKLPGINVEQYEPDDPEGDEQEEYYESSVPFDDDSELEPPNQDIPF